MNNDHDGLVGDPRNGQSGESQKTEKSISKTNEQGDNSSNGGDLSHERSIIEEGEAEEVVVAALRKIGVASSWSGLLPRPEDFSKYDVHVQEKMLAWNDAQILDESKRNDRLVNAEVKQGYISLVFTFVINTLIIVGVLIAFVVTNNPNVFWAFTLPGASVVGNVVISVKDKGKSKDQKSEEDRNNE